MTWKPVVVGVDTSPEAREAAALGVRIAERGETDCYLVHGVRPLFPAPLGTDFLADVDAAVDRQLERVRADLVAWLAHAVPQATLDRLDVRLGRAAGAVAEAAREREAGVVVLGGKRHSTLGRWVAGSTAHHLVRAIDAPVLVTGPSPHTVRRVLAALDLSYAVQPTFEAAVRFARLFGARLRVVHAVESVPLVAELPVLGNDEAFFADSEDQLERCLEPLTEELAVERAVRRGVAADVITAEAIEWSADLVVLGSHGRGWMDRILVGSTTERLLNAPPTSLLIVPVPAPPGERARGRRERVRRTRRRAKRQRDTIII